jgi:hypothetical protein
MGHNRFGLGEGGDFHQFTVKYTHFFVKHLLSAVVLPVTIDALNYFVLLYYYFDCNLLIRL